MDKQQASIHYNIGRELVAKGELHSALKHYAQATILNANHAKAWNNMGNLQKRLGNFKQAISCYEASIKADNSPHVWVNLGNTFLTLGDGGRSVDCYLQALKQEPSHILASINLGVSLIEQGLLEQAFKHLANALGQHAGNPELLMVLGDLYMAAGRAADAVGAFERALSATQKPGLNCILALANAYSKNNAADKAIGVLESHRAKFAGSVEMNLALGQQYKNEGYFVKARACFGAVRETRPDELLADLRYQSLCPAVMPSVQAIEHYRSNLANTLDKALQHRWKFKVDELFISGCEPPFYLSYHGQNDLPLKNKYGELFSRNLPMVREPVFGKERPHVGVVVTPGHEGIFLKSVIPMLNGFSQNELKVTVLCPRSSLAVIRKQVHSQAIEFFPVTSRITNTLAQLQQVGFDLIYYHEIGSDSLNYFLPYFGLAPIQCTTWGIQVTSGIPTMDYYLSSRWTETEQAQQHYNEQLVLLDTLLKYQLRPECTTQVKSRQGLGLPEQAHLYACPHNLAKIHPHFDAAMAGILRVDTAALIVLVEWPTAEAGRQLWRRFHKDYPDVSDRLKILPHLHLQDYYSLIKCADILLDPFYFSGVNCTFDAFAFNKIVVTWPGEFQRGSFTFGCYQRMGILEAVATSVEDYISKAVNFVMNPPMREDLEIRLTERTEILFADSLIPAELENTLLKLILEARAG